PGAFDFEGDERAEGSVPAAGACVRRAGAGPAWSYLFGAGAGHSADAEDPEGAADLDAGAHGADPGCAGADGCGGARTDDGVDVRSGAALAGAPGGEGA